MPVTTSILDSLAELNESELDRLAESSRAYNSPAWWHVYDDVPVERITGGRVGTRYVVVRDDDGVAAVTPLLHVRRAEEFFGYSLRRFYFEHFFEVAEGTTVDARTRRLFGLAKRYGGFLRMLGCDMDEMLVATSPLAYGSGIATIDDDPARTKRSYANVAAAVRDEARRLRCPALLPFLEPGLEALHAEGFREVFQCYDNRIPLDEHEDLDGYLATFSKSSRQNKRREMRRTAEAGIVFETLDDAEPHAKRLTDLYERTSRQHAHRFPRFPPEYWTALKRSFGDQLQLLVARRGEEIVGFHTLLECPVTGDLCSHRVGRDDREGLEDVPFYFVMCFYEPIRRALERGFTGLRLGPGSDNGKRRRGAQQFPQHGYVWFPRSIDRFLMGRYMVRFGNQMRSTIAGSTDLPLDVVGEKSPTSAES